MPNRCVFSFRSVKFLNFLHSKERYRFLKQNMWSSSIRIQNHGFILFQNKINTILMFQQPLYPLMSSILQLNQLAIQSRRLIFSIIIKNIPFKILKRMNTSPATNQKLLTPPQLKSSKKIICLKCSYSIDQFDYEFHQHECDGLDEQIIYYPKVQNHQMNFSKDIDLLDFPISKASVQYNKVGNAGHDSVALQTRIKKSDSLKEQNCCFCSEDIKTSQKYVSLPCRHFLHTKCVKKWLIIVEPCKFCNDSSDCSETCHTERSLKNLHFSL